MGAPKWVTALVIIATAITGAAQQRNPGSVGLDSPVPAWPANGVIPPELKNHYVFVDTTKGEYVVAYPENLASPNFEKDGPGQRQVNRYKLQRDVEPAINVAIAAAGGKYKYAYTVSNKPNAKQSLDQWALVLPDTLDTAATKQPAGWFGVVQKDRKFTVANPDWIKSGAAAVFSFQKSEGPIPPGGRKDGFEIESELKPGFTVGFFRQTESLDATLQASGNIPSLLVRNATVAPPPGSAPPAAAGGGGGFGGAQVPAAATAAWQLIKDDIDKVLRFEYNSKTLVTLAPKFDKSATDKVIAADFMQGITVLSQTGVLIAESQFVKSTISDLDAYVKAGGSGPLKLSAQPKSEAETGVFNAMKLSLHLN